MAADATVDRNAPDYWHTRYQELSQAVYMVRIALEESFGADIMSVGATPNPIVECEEIAKADTHKITKANVVRIRGDQYGIEFEFDDGTTATEKVRR